MNGAGICIAVYHRFADDPAYFLIHRRRRGVIKIYDKKALFLTKLHIIINTTEENVKSAENHCE